MITRDDCLRRDAADPLAPLRDHFAMGQVDRDGLIYLDGNSLGALPKHATIHLMHVMEEEWGRRPHSQLEHRRLDRSGAAHRRQDRDAGRRRRRRTDRRRLDVDQRLQGAERPRVAIAPPGRTRIVSERTNFPTDLYIAETFARDRGMELVLVDDSEIAAHLDDRAGDPDADARQLPHRRMHDMAASRVPAHRGRRDRDLGSCAFGGCGAGRSSRRRTPISRSAAATST